MPCLIDEFAVVRACIVPEPVEGEDEASLDSLFEPNFLLRKSPDNGPSCERPLLQFRNASKEKRRI